ncbi:MAG TPA: hypothetical protein VGB46_11060 [Flavisolibacter sp.]|jgi:hypothetical protein
MRFLLPAAICFLLFACSQPGTGEMDHEHEYAVDHNDTTAPVIEVYRPSAGQQFRNGDTLRVEGKASDIGLHGGLIKIMHGGTVIKQQSYELHIAQTHNFSLTHVIQLSAPTTYTITIEFEDHGRNKTEKTITVEGKP